MTINEAQDNIIEDFDLFDDWEGKYEYIIDLGKKLPPMNDTFKTDENIIKGCQSVVWLQAEYKDGKVFFEGDSQAIIVKGLVSMLLSVYSNQTPEAISDSNLYFIDKIGLGSHLAQTRANGLAAMVQQIKNYAVAYKALENRI